jgi:hypothetical protein
MIERYDNCRPCLAPFLKDLFPWGNLAVFNSYVAEILYLFGRDFISRVIKLTAKSDGGGGGGLKGGRSCSNSLAIVGSPGGESRRLGGV